MRKPRIVTVSHRRQALDDPYQYPSVNTRQSNRVIHVIMGSVRQVPSKNNNPYSTKENIRTNTHVKQKPASQIGSSSKLGLLSRSPRVGHHESAISEYNQSTKDSSDPIDMANNNSSKSKQKKKTKCSRKCLLLSAIITLSVIVIVTVILVALLVKPKTTTKPSTIPVLRWNSTGITVAGITGTPGNASNQLNTPTDVKLDYANNLYIADYLNNRIQKYLFGSSTGRTVAGNGTNASSQYQLTNPARVTLDANENLYVTDTWNSRIQFWPNGDISGSTVAGITGSSGNANNQLQDPFDVALDPTSATLYIADTYNYRIMSYASGANNGALLLGGTGPGTNNTQLDIPAGIYLDSLSNSLIIANYGSNNIVRYVLGANHWTLLAGDINGAPGNTSTSLSGPLEVTLDPMGNMYVADFGNNRIQFFYNGQSTGTTIAGITGSSGNNATTLNSPWSVRLDNQLNLYVTDSANHRIQKFLRY